MIEHLNANDIRPGDIIVDPVKLGESSGEVWTVRHVYDLPNNKAAVKWFLDPLFPGGSPVTRVIGRTEPVAVDCTRYDPEKSMDELKELLDAL